MPDTTTISVRTDQAEWLKSIMGKSGSYKTALDKAREGYEQDAEAVDVDADAVADALSERIDMDGVDDILAGQTEIQEETARMARSLETVEERTGKLDRSLEELGGR